MGKLFEGRQLLRNCSEVRTSRKTETNVILECHILGEPGISARTVISRLNKFVMDPNHFIDIWEFLDPYLGDRCLNFPCAIDVISVEISSEIEPNLT